MVKGPLGSIVTFLYSRIWNFITVLTKKKFPGGNFLNLHTVFAIARALLSVKLTITPLTDPLEECSTFLKPESVSKKKIGQNVSSGLILTSRLSNILKVCISPRGRSSILSVD